MSRAGGRRRAVEWPTWVMLLVAYGLWCLGIALYPVAGVFGLMLLSGLAATLHASLQHECLHGHPTRSAAVNEALVFPSLVMLFPYRRFKELHLRHHHDERLTDPYDDPESWYLSEGSYATASPALRVLLRLNGSLCGRMLLGPWLSLFGMWRADWSAARRSRAAAAKMVDAYVRHLVGIAIVLSAAWMIGGVDPVTYVIFVSWPGAAILMLRTYIEHRAEKTAAERTAVVEAEPLFALLFLNNNLHAVHHDQPRLPWYALPSVWRRDCSAILERNGGYFVPGYLSVIRRWFWRAREPVVHPFARRASPLSGGGSMVAAATIESEAAAEAAQDATPAIIRGSEIGRAP